MQVLRELEISKDGPSDKYLVATRYVATIEKSDFFNNAQDIYFEHDFILTDLAAEFEYRKSIN